MDIHKYQVDRPYSMTRRKWPEHVDYNFRGGEHELRLFLPSPTEHEVAAVKKGECEFGLYVEPPLIVLCYRFAYAGRGIPWSDTPFSWHMMVAATPEHEHILPINWEDGSPDTRALVQIILVNADNGIVRALRVVTWSPQFTRAIHKAIWEQAHAPFDQEAYDRAHRDLYRRYPKTDSLVQACSVRTLGGA